MTSGHIHGRSEGFQVIQIILYNHLNSILFLSDKNVFKDELNRGVTPFIRFLCAILSVEITKLLSFVYECAEFSFFYCSRSTDQGRPWCSQSSILEVMPYHEDKIPVDTYVVSRDVATNTRSMTLDGPVDMYVVSRDVATNTRSMTLNGPSHWSGRLKILEFSRSHTRSLFLAMVSKLALVTPAVVRVCRCLVYCTGSPPPGIVSCVGILYLWRRVCLLPYSACAALLDIIVVCMCMWLCMCKCMCWSCAGAVHVQLYVLCGCSVQVYCVACMCTNFGIFFPHMSFAPLVFCVTL